MWVQCFAIKRCTFFGYKVMEPGENRNLLCLRKVMTVGWCKWQLVYPSILFVFAKLSALCTFCLHSVDFQCVTQCV